MNLSTDYKSRFRILKGGKVSLVVSALLSTVTISFAAPSGGVVTSGNATISQNGKITNIDQSSSKASINWNKFGIKADEIVNFNQPNTNSITLNRVIGNERSIIDGALNANGQVWILNSNGVLFGKNASINTAGLLASTKNISDTDFQQGNYTFSGDSTESIINEGTIKVSNNSYVVFASDEVQNKGVIEAIKGRIQLTGANEYTINLNGNSLVELRVEKGLVDSLVENSGTIIANGGEVYLTTYAVDELLAGVVNNTGIIEANSLDGIYGHVELFAHGGTANIDGTIKAKGSFVETSGKELNVASTTKIEASKWLLDPVDMTIENTGGSDLSGASVSATAIQNALSSMDVELQADQDITVNENITWSDATQLKLSAGDEVYVNATINNTNNTNGGVYFNAANTTDKVIFGVNGKVIVNNAYQLQWIDTALNGKYELGSNIDASVTSSWNTGVGFNPIGNFTAPNDYTLAFQGSFDGKGYTINDLFINRPTETEVALFGATDSAALIQNVGLRGGSITGYDGVASLVGINKGTVRNSYATGSVTAKRALAGGLVAYNTAGGLIESSYATGDVYGEISAVGGLVGMNDAATIRNSYASGKVTGGSGSTVGGLLGMTVNGTIENLYWNSSDNATGIGAINGTAMTNIVGITNADAFTAANYGNLDVADWYIMDGIRPMLKMEYSTTITNDHQLQLIAADLNASYTMTNDVTFNVGDNTGTSMWSSSGFVPIGYIDPWEFDPARLYDSAFKGTLDGLGHTINDLNINRDSQSGVGLFRIIDPSAVVKNIILKGGSVHGNENTGAIIGVNGGTLQNASSSADVSGPYRYIGGLVGINGGTLDNVYSTGNVTTGLSYAGGLVGTSSTGIIKNAYATGAVTGTASYSNYIGGLVGQNLSASTIEYAYATGSVSTPNSPGANNGALVGENTGTIQKSYWNRSTYGSVNGVGGGNSTGGTGLDSSQMQNKDSFVGWNIEEDSTLSSSYLYPVPVYSGGTTTWKIYPRSGADTDNVLPPSTQTKIDKVVNSIIAKQTVSNRDLNTLIQSGIDVSSFINQLRAAGNNIVIIPGVALKVLNGGINLPFGIQRTISLDESGTNEEEEKKENKI